MSFVAFSETIFWQVSPYALAALPLFLINIDALGFNLAPHLFSACFLAVATAYIAYASAMCYKHGLLRMLLRALRRARIYVAETLAAIDRHYLGKMSLVFVVVFTAAAVRLFVVEHVRLFDWMRATWRFVRALPYLLLFDLPALVLAIREWARAVYLDQVAALIDFTWTQLLRPLIVVNPVLGALTIGGTLLALLTPVMLLRSHYMRQRPALRYSFGNVLFCIVFVWAMQRVYALSSYETGFLAGVAITVSVVVYLSFEHCWHNGFLPQFVYDFHNNNAAGNGNGGDDDDDNDDDDNNNNGAAAPNKRRRNSAVRRSSAD
jgi:hypothetical protein